MSCKYPLHAFPTGLKTDNGKEQYFITKTHDEFIPAREVSARFGVPFFRDLHEYIELPCGHCRECKKEKANKWAFRCACEALEHESNLFITLTYDNAHIRKEANKKDFQKFIKDLRNLGFKFRYFLCGEFGEHTHRFHGHALLFGLKLDDLKPAGFSGKFRVFTSETIAKVWNKGFHSIGIAQAGAVGQYIAKYTLKNLDDQKGFILMSKKPGIGFKKIQELLKTATSGETLFCSNGQGGLVYGSVPRSLREKLALPADEVNVALAQAVLACKMGAVGLDYENSYQRENYFLMQDEMFENKLGKL